MESILNPSVRLYALISSKSDEATAKEAVSILDEVVKERVTIETKELATKSDLLLLKAEMINIKAEMIKWMFIFWIGQIALLSGIIFVLMKLYFHQ